MLIFMSSAQEPPAVRWQPSAPAFHTRELKAEEDSVRSFLPARVVTYLGSHEGCGCGFQGADPELEHEEEQKVSARQSLQSLRRFVAEQLKHQTRLWLYASESDDLALGVRSTRTVTPRDLDPDSFYFRNGELIEVRAA
jgi:hypothetical protein